MTHRLGNNRTDKLQGTRRSQARGRGRRRRPDVPGGPGGSRSTPPSVQGAFLKRTETPTTSLALARRPPPPARPPPTFAALPAAGRPRTCRTMSWARRPKQPALPRAPEPEPRPERGAQAERAARGPGRPRLSPPPPLRSPTWRGPRVRSVQRGAELGRGPGTPPLRQGRGGAPEPRRGVPLPFACPQLPDAPSPHPTTPIKVHFGRESGLRLPLAPPGGSAHFAPRELSDPGGGGGSRAWPPLPPRGGLAVPPNRTCGSPQADIFFAEAASAPRSARLRIPPRREEPRLNPFVPGPLPPPAPRKWGRRGGGGEEPAGTGWSGRAAGGQSTRRGEAGRGRAGGEGRETCAGTPRSRAGPPAEDASSGPRERGGGPRGASSSCSRPCLRPRSGAAETPLRAHLDPLPAPPSPGTLSPEGCGSGASRGGHRRCTSGEGAPGRLRPRSE